MLVLKLVLAPALIGMASWIARRWGPACGGWFVALPLTSGPALLILSLEQGPRFTAQAGVGAMLAVIALAAFALAYGWSARRSGWGASSLAGCLAYLAAASVLQLVSLPLTW